MIIIIKEGRSSRRTSFLSLIPNPDFYPYHMNIKVSLTSKKLCCIKIAYRHIFLISRGFNLHHKSPDNRQQTFTHDYLSIKHKIKCNHCNNVYKLFSLNINDLSKFGGLLDIL